MSKLNIAIIGQGYMGRTHATAWGALGQHISYVCTPRPRGEFEEAPEAQIVTDLDRVLDDPEVDVVSVCTPTPTHREIAIAALEAGKNVLLEKPIALTVEDAMAIYEAGREAPGTLMVAQVVRFFPGYAHMRARVEQGAIGEVLSARGHRMSLRPDWAQWWLDESQSGGTLVDFAIHDFDQMNLFLGAPVAVTTTANGRYGPFHTSIEYRSGAIAQVLSHTDLPKGATFMSGIQLVGSEGVCEFEFNAGSATDSGSSASRFESVGYRGFIPSGLEHEIPMDADPYTEQARYFLECVTADVPPTRSSTVSAILALETSLAAQESLASQRRVEISSVVSELDEIESTTGY